jgi:predicted metalloprotease with PDZ domain
MARREDLLDLEEEMEELRNVFKAYRVQSARKIQVLQDENAALRARLEEKAVVHG